MGLSGIAKKTTRTAADRREPDDVRTELTMKRIAAFLLLALLACSVAHAFDTFTIFGGIDALQGAIQDIGDIH